MCGVCGAVVLQVFTEWLTQRLTVSELDTDVLGHYVMTLLEEGWNGGEHAYANSVELLMLGVEALCFFVVVSSCLFPPTN